MGQFAQNLQQCLPENADSTDIGLNQSINQSIKPLTLK